MPSATDFFVIGKRYRNRIGAYEVLDIGTDGMRIRYDDGSEQVIHDLALQERIVSNIELEAEIVAPYGEKDKRNSAYFRTLGFLARRARIEAIVPLKAQYGFEEHYEELKGKRPRPGSDMYYLHTDPNTDKWGCELRISFEATIDEMEALEFGPDVRVVAGMQANEYRINNNGFIWHLFELGFCLGAKQNHSAILAKLPPVYQAEFERGFGRQ